MKRLECCQRLNNTLQISAIGSLRYLPCRHAGMVCGSFAELLATRRILATGGKRCAVCEHRKEPLVEFRDEDFRPERIVLASSMKCNLACYYCWRNIHREDYKRNLFDTFAPVLEKRFIAKAKRLDWIMGEFYFDEYGRNQFLEYGRKYGLRLHVVTNGVLYDPAIPVDSITLSLHGFDRESYIHNTGSDVFADVCAAIKKMPEGVLTDVNVVMCAYNREHVTELAEFIIGCIPKAALVRLAFCVGDSRRTGKIKGERKVLRGVLEKAGYNVTMRGA